VLKDKILALDLDDTLVDSESAYDYALRFVGIDPNGENFLEARRLTKKNLSLNAPSARSRFLYFKVFLEISGHYSAKKHIELFQSYQLTLSKHIFDQCENLGRRKLLEDMRTHFKKIIIITNETTFSQVQKIEAIDPEGQLFDQIITSEEVGVEKPDTRIFNYALKKINCSPEQVTFIGDSFVNDIQPAINLGMKAIKTIEFQDDKLFSSKHHIINKLEEYFLHL
jgi:putative hydrolase of the HAD superfamily